VKAKQIDVIIADSQMLIRMGLKHLFQNQSRINVVDEVTSSEELLEAATKFQPDVVIFDYNQPSHFKIEDIPEVKKISPDSQFLIISANNNKEEIFQVLQSGGLSFLTKECDEDEIISAVMATARGDKFLCNKVIDVILEKNVTEDEITCAPTNLTVRELEIVKLTAKGFTAGKVADQLYLSTHTVYTHRKNIMKKLGINSASELIVYAINNGL
jgi:DNA-binding NarL/FixJ family response regulator